MLTFLTLLIIYLIASSIITHFRNQRAIKKAAADMRQLPQTYSYPILMPVYGRPHYLKEVLHALAQVKNIDKTVLIISQDGHNKDVSDLIAQIKFTRTIIIKHTRPFLGILAYFWDSLVAASTNIYFLLNFAFLRTEAKGAVVLEDDIVPSVDFFNYFQWTFAHVLNDKRVLSVTGFNIDSRALPEKNCHPQNHPYDLLENTGNKKAKFTGWSWAISKDKWMQVRKQWSFMSWDIELDKLQRKLGFISYKPVLARAKNIGMQGGINFTEAEDNPKWHDIFMASQSYDYKEKPRFCRHEDFPKIPLNEEHCAACLNERTKTRKNRWKLLIIIALITIVEYYILFLR